MGYDVTNNSSIVELGTSQPVETSPLNTIVLPDTVPVPVQVLTEGHGADSRGTITIEADGGIPPYTYSIDGVNYQSSNVFTNVNRNNITVYIKDDIGTIVTIQGIDATGVVHYVEGVTVIPIPTLLPSDPLVLTDPTIPFQSTPITIPEVLPPDGIVQLEGISIPIFDYDLARNVTYIGLALPLEFIVSGSPITSYGTLTGEWADAAANEMFAGPDGASGTPAFRALIDDDLPVSYDPISWGTAYTHSQIITGNPHDIGYGDIADFAAGVTAYETSHAGLLSASGIPAATQVAAWTSVDQLTGSNNLLWSGTQLQVTGSVRLTTTLDFTSTANQIWVDGSGNLSFKDALTGTATLADLIGGGGGSGVVSVGAGNGMDFTTITASGNVILGTPSTTTTSTINQATGTTHTHALDLSTIFGLDEQVPVTNATTNGYDFFSGFTFDGIGLYVDNITIPVTNGIYFGDGDTYITESSDDILYAYALSNAVLSIDGLALSSSGAVGIASDTTAFTPTARLDVRGESQTAIYASSSSNTYGLFLYVTGSGSAAYLRSYSSTGAHYRDTIRSMTAATAGAIGLGTGILFELENAASGIESAGRMGVKWTDVTALAEESQMIFGIMTAGAYAEIMSLDGVSLNIDTVNEYATDAGVTIEGVLLKDLGATAGVAWSPTADQDFMTKIYTENNFDNYQSWGIVDGIYTRDVISADEIEFLGDTTYIQVQYDGYLGNVHTMQFTYVGPTDFYVGWDLWVDSVDTTRVVTSGMDVNFISGTYTTITHNFLTGPPPHNDLTFEVDTTALRGHLDSYYYDFATYPSLATQSWVTSNFDNYVSWAVYMGGVDVPANDVASGQYVDFDTNTPTYMQVQWDQTNRTIEIDYVGPTDFYAGWDPGTDTGTGHTRVGSAHDVNFVGGTYLTTAYAFATAVHDITIDIDQTAFNAAYYTQAAADAAFYSRSYIDTNTDNYGGWDLWAGVLRSTIASGDEVDFLSGTDITVAYTAPGGRHTLTFNYTGTPGTMDDWYMAVDYVPGVPVTHTIQNHTIVDFQGGTYIDATYTFVTPVHGVAFDINTTALDGRYYTQTAADLEFYDRTYINSNFDNYGGWDLWAGVFQNTINSGEQVEFLGGTDIGVVYSVPVSGRPTLTFNYSGSPGTMDDWYFVVDGGANYTIANHGTVDFQAGTNVTLTYTFVTGIHGVIINSTDQYQGTVTSVVGGTGISSTGGTDPTLALTVDELAEKAGDLVGADRLVGTTATTNWAETISGIPLSIFSNDSGWTSNAGTVTSVTGGTGIASTGGTTPSLSLTVDELAEKSGALVGTDRLVGTSGIINFAETINQIPLSFFNNDAGWADGTGDMDSWTFYVDSDAGHTISNLGSIDLVAGTGVTVAYSLAVSTHTATISADLSAYYTSAQVDAGFYSQTWIDTNIYTIIEADAAFDDYGGWDVYTGSTLRETIVAGERVDFVGGTDIQVIYTATGNILTFNYTGTPGTMSSWNWEIEGSPHTISNTGTAELIAGTNVTISYSLGGGGEHQATINSTDQYVGTVTSVTGGTGISSTGGTTPDISLNLSELAVTTMVAADWIAFDDAGVSSKALISTIPLSIFNNDAGWTTNLGTVTSVLGGVGVSATGTTAVTIALTVDELAEKPTAVIATDRLVGTSGTVNFAHTINTIPVSAFNNDANYASGTGFMDSWNLFINTTGGPYAIANDSGVDLIAGTNVSITRTIDIGINRVTINSTDQYVGTVTAVTGGVGITSTEGTTPSISLDFSELTDMTASIAGTTELILQNGTVESRKAASEIQLSFFNNDSGWTSNAGTVTSVTGGVGIDSTGGTTPSIAFNGSELTTGDALVGTDYIVAVNAAVSEKHQLLAINLSAFNNDSGWASGTGFMDDWHLLIDTDEIGGPYAIGNHERVDFIPGTGIAIAYNFDTPSATNQITISSTITAGVTAVTGGYGLQSTGGTTPEISEDFDNLSAGGVLIAGDHLVAVNGTTGNKQLISAIPLSIFNNDAVWSSTVGTVTLVGGTGTVNGITLTGSFSTSGNLTLGGTLGSIANSQLTNSTISGVALGSNLASITWGVGLSGTSYNGSAAVTTALDFSELTDMTATIAGTTEFILQNGVTESRKAANEIALSFFNNDSGWTSNVGTVTNVTGGTGIDVANGTTTPSITLDLSELGVTTMTGADWIAFDDAGTSSKALISTIPLSLFTNDEGWSSGGGTMSNWYLNTDHVDSPKSIQNTAEVYLIGGTGIDLTELVWSTGNLRWEMTIDATGGASVSFGTTTQIPYMNAGGTDFIYSSNLVFDGTSLTVPDINVSESENALNALVYASNANIGALAGASVFVNANGMNVALAAYSDAHALGPNHARLQSTAGGANIGIGSTTELGFLWTLDGAVDLYHNNIAKFSTTSTGATVYGTASSNFLITGTTTGGSWGAAITLNSTANIRGRGIFYTHDADSTEWFSGIGYNQNGFVIAYDLTGGQAEYTTNTLFRITTAGNVTITGGLFAAGEVESYDTSDMRVKDVIEQLDPIKTTEDLMGLDTFRYRHKIKDRIEIGLSAQQTQVSFSENVKEDQDGFLMIHYGKMVPALLAMNKYQEKRIREQDKRISYLEQKLAKY